MTRRPRGEGLSWWAGAALLPLVLIAALLGVVTSADTALERIPVALVNNDELVEQVDEEGEEEIILASRPLVTELVSNEELAVNWVFTSSDEADKLLRSGEVYAVLEIPENFSRAVTTLDSESPEQASFAIRTDSSHSYLAGVLADSLGETIAMTISDEFGRTLTEGLFTAIVDLGGGIAEAADAAEEVADGAAELADGVGELKDGSAELAEGTKDLADGYAEFDDGLEEYLDGLRELADGAETLNRGTSSLPELSDGVTTYTESLTGLSGLLGAYLKRATADPALTLPEFLALPVGTLLGDQAPPGTEMLTVSDVVANINTLATSGPTLATNVDKAIAGVRTGIEGIDEGADLLAENSYTLEEGSDEIRQAVIDLADGVEEFDDGVTELRDGTDELAEGVQEFADGLREGADEFEAEGISEPSETTLDTLTSPIALSDNSTAESIGFQETLTSALIPIGLWFVALLGTLRLPPVSPRMLSSTSTTRRLYATVLRPVLAIGALQLVVAVALMHTLGGLAWTDIGWSTLMVAITVLTFVAAHLAVWLWKPALVAAVSITAGVVQVLTLGSLIPIEALPGLYQAIGAASPMAWSTDGLIAAIAAGEAGRIGASVTALLSLAAVSLVAGWVALGRRRVRAVRESLGLTDAVL